jgi:hypothetical protein
MNRATTIALLAAVATTALAVVLWSKYFGTRYTETFLEGEVISVEFPRPDGKQSPRPSQAIVKLATGESVHASVPSSYLVKPGQVTRVAQFGAGREASYVVMENGR